MITYLYWFLVGALLFATLFFIGVRLEKWKPAFITALIILVITNLLYYFWLEQMFVKRWGGAPCESRFLRGNNTSA